MHQGGYYDNKQHLSSFCMDIGVKDWRKNHSSFSVIDVVNLVVSMMLRVSIIGTLPAVASQQSLFRPHGSRCVRRYMLLLMLSLFICSGVSAHSLSSIDSIRIRLPHLHGKEKLKAMRNICVIAIGNDDHRQVNYIREFVAEAARMNSAKDEAYGRHRMLCYYYNYDKSDSLKLQLKPNLERLVQLNEMGRYYDSWSLLVEHYFYTDKLMDALAECRRLFADARRRKSNYGYAVANNLAGLIYDANRSEKNAFYHFSMAIGYAKKVDDNNLLLRLIYSNFCDALYNAEKYDSLWTIASDWKRLLDQQSYKFKHNHIDLAGLFFDIAYCNLSLAEAKMEMGDLQTAATLLKTVGKDFDRHTIRVRTAFLHDMARYWQLSKDCDKALAYSKKAYILSKDIDDRIGMLSQKEHYAHILLEAGRYEESSRLFSEIIEANDTLYASNMQRQLAGMSVYFRMHDMEEAQKRSRGHVYLMLGLLVLLALVVGFYLWYTYKLRKKEKVLFKTINRFKLSERLNLTYLESIPKDKLKDDETLYLNLCRVMDHDKPYLNPDFSRDTMASMLATNRTYIGDAIRKYASGLTIQQFITRYRLRYAASLLVGRPDMSVNDVGMASGFNSRVTFIRLFREFFGVTPAVFRESSDKIQG